MNSNKEFLESIENARQRLQNYIDNCLPLDCRGAKGWRGSSLYSKGLLNTILPFIKMRGSLNQYSTLFNHEEYSNLLEKSPLFVSRYRTPLQEQFMTIAAIVESRGVRIHHDPVAFLHMFAVELLNKVLDCDLRYPALSENYLKQVARFEDYITRTEEEHLHLLRKDRAGNYVEVSTKEKFELWLEATGANEDQQ